MGGIGSSGPGIRVSINGGPLKSLLLAAQKSDQSGFSQGQRVSKKGEPLQSTLLNEHDAAIYLPKDPQSCLAPKKHAMKDLETKGNLESWINNYNCSPPIIRFELEHHIPLTLFCLFLL